MNTEELNSPPIVSTPTDQHAQNMWVLGVMKGRLDSIDERIGSLVDESRIRNGRIEKIEGRVSDVEKWQSASDGEEKGISATWAVIVALAGLVMGGLSVWVAIIALHIHIGN